MLDFRIHTFLCVCRHMNYTRAAAELHITQPAVSQHIRYLEREYGAKLFSYKGKHLQLTQAGHILWNAATAISHDDTLLKSICMTCSSITAPCLLARRQQPAWEFSINCHSFSSRMET